MQVFLETERLVLRRLTEDDLDHLVELDGDPAVMRYLNGGQPTPREVIQSEILPRFLGYYERYDGFGVWAAVEKSSGDFLGWFSLRPADGESGDSADEVHLGYRLRQAAWGKGYATEGARALIRKAFMELGACRVVASTYEENRASRRVMEKARLRLVRTFRLTPTDLVAVGSFHATSQEIWEGDEVEYALEKSDWERQEASEHVDTGADDGPIAPAASLGTSPSSPLDIATVRAQFPALALEQDGQPVVYFDNPGGTQVPRECIEAIADYLTTSSANTGGAFPTSQRTDAMLAEAHAAMADMLGAVDAREIVFGPNMTTLTFAISRAIGRTLSPGDEIVVTALDHDANVAPWLAVAEERGLTVRMAEVDLATCTLDLDDLRAKITPQTKLVAVGYASNAVGTINDVATIIGWAREVGALTWIDAVQYAPHGPIDVASLGCDFLACSAYKFFGPHLGVVYGRLELLERLRSYKVRPAGNASPDKWETGTLNHECLAGLLGTLRYLTALGEGQVERYGGRFAGMAGRRLALHCAFAAIQEHERGLVERLLAGLRALLGVKIYGLTAPEDLPRRVPTVALTLEGHTPRELAEKLAARGIFCWDGNYYALTLMERLGLEGHGGALRIGLAHYNTVDEVGRLLAAL
jgi:cysteine desulfurase family protein (TIGR01976 family)